MKDKRVAFKIWKKQNNKKTKKKKFNSKKSSLTTESNIVVKTQQSLTEVFSNLMEVCKNLVARAHYCIENHENLEEEETDEDIDDDEEEHVR